MTAADRPMANDLIKSKDAVHRMEELIPGGAHTYAKGADQFPLGLAPVISHGRGAHVWDVDDNRYIEYGSGLRSVVLGHAHPKVLAAVRAELPNGSNFARPSVRELHAAERFLQGVDADMVKFAKNGSDVTSAAVKIARAATGRKVVARCSDQPFFSVDDWFIGTTPLSAGIPDEISNMTVGFPYGDLAAVETLLCRHEGQIACLILEPATQDEPAAGYLQGMLDLAHRHGALLVFDEMITGFRWARGGVQSAYGVTPDLSTWGKALGNGFAVSALAGRREFMSLGGLDHDRERVFLLSTTHGAETHSLAAALAVMDVFDTEDTPAELMRLGARLADGVTAAARAAGVADHVVVRGRACNMVFATLDENRQPSQEFRTLFMRQLLLGGVLAPSFVVSSALTDADIDETVDVVAQACSVYREALEYGDAGPWTGGRPTKPVFRRFA